MEKKKRVLLALLIPLFFAVSLEGAFDEKNDILWHPAFSSSSFLPHDYLANTSLLFAACGTQRYCMDECTEVRTLLHTALPFARVGIDGCFFGSTLYNESTCGISVFTKTRTALGVRLKAMRLGIKDYQSSFMASGDLLFSSSHDFFQFQTCFNNAFSLGNHSEGDKPLSSFTSLTRFYPVHWYSLNFRISFSEFTGLATEIGNGIKVSESVWIGGGFDLQTKELSSHLLASYKRGSLSYAIAIHPVLGITHTVGFIFSIKGKGKEQDER